MKKVMNFFIKQSFVIVLVFIFTSFFVKAQAYVDSTGYAGTATIDNTSHAVAHTNHQITFNLDTQALISAGRMQSDCDDLRILDSDDTTKLSYWIESGCNTTTTKIWVKVPSISASTTKILHVYYGNVALSSEASGANTFIFFDDFTSINGSTWISTGTSAANSGGPLVIPIGDNGKVLGVVSFGLGCARPDWEGVYAYLPAYEQAIKEMIAAVPDRYPNTIFLPIIIRQLDEDIIQLRNKRYIIPNDPRNKIITFTYPVNAQAVIAA